VAAATAEAVAVATLHCLNAHHIRVFVESDTTWYSEHLGKGGVSADVPALKDVRKSLTVAQLSSIINHGFGESANPQKPYMPVWGPVISKRTGSPISSRTFATG
jgi:hypothetical protein